MSELIEKEHFESIESLINNGNMNEIHWSSGQYILLYTITEVISKLKKNLFCCLMSLSYIYIPMR